MNNQRSLDGIKVASSPQHPYPSHQQQASQPMWARHTPAWPHCTIALMISAHPCMRVPALLQAQPHHGAGATEEGASSKALHISHHMDHQNNGD